MEFPKGKHLKRHRANYIRQLKLFPNKDHLELTRGLVTKIDPELFDQLAIYKWFAIPRAFKRYNTGQDKVCYAVRNEWQGSNKKIKNKQIFLHREIWEIKKYKITGKLEIDHLNRNSLDNRLENLNLVSKKQNLQNTSRNVLVEYQGETKTLNQWAEDLNIQPNTLYARWRRNIRDVQRLFAKQPLLKLYVKISDNKGNKFDSITEASRFHNIALATIKISLEERRPVTTKRIAFYYE